MNRQRHKKALRAELHHMRKRFVQKVVFCDACESPVLGTDVPQGGQGYLVLAIVCACSGFVVGILVGGVW